MEPTRLEAEKLFKRYNKSPGLYKHALAVEAVMRHIAELNNEDVEKWGIIGLLHDLDYEQYPDQHCTMSGKIMREELWPEDYIHAVVSHGWGICSDVEPTELMEKFLFATDELTGLVTTTALVRPSKSVLDMKVKSVKNKWKDKRFAAGVDRSIIVKGAEMLGVDVSELIELTIDGMKTAAAELGLAGEPEASAESKA
ncbi:MAG: HDIG domain-containing protein [Spirochaetales bacterium]|nr:HDIG domain-containing protein [Spirochaetales bacterium]